MLKYVLAYVGSAVGFIALDALWLTFAGPKLYRPVEDQLLLGSVRIAPAIAFYVLFVAGIVFLAVRPALASGRWNDALINGAVFGLIAYATYALTNHAIMKVWTPQMTLIDMAWGAIASGMGATIGFFVARYAVR